MLLHHDCNACCYDFRSTTAPSAKHLVMADPLSRAFSPREVPSTIEEDVQIHVCAVKAELSVSKRKWNEIAEETGKDEVLKQVIRSIKVKDGVAYFFPAKFAMITTPNVCQ